MANSAALTLLGCQQLAQYDQLKPILQEKEKKERLSLSQNQMKLQNETITILSIKDISNELNDKESESWNKLSHVLTHEIMNTIAPIISLSQTLSHIRTTAKKTLRGLHIIQAQSERLLEFTESFRRLLSAPTGKETVFTNSPPAKSARTPVYRFSGKSDSFHTYLSAGIHRYGWRREPAIPSPAQSP